MARLVAFAQALAPSPDLKAIEEIATAHLPGLAGSPDAWALALVRKEWRTVGRVGQVGQVELRLALARQVVRKQIDLARFPFEAEGDVLVPLVAGETALGILGVPVAAAPSGVARLQALTAAAGLLASALHNAALFQDLRETSLRDGLTGCYNRMHALEMVASELRRARRSHLPLSLIMFDLDHFKAINDTHGHQCGDLVLATVGARMREVLRVSDLKCRYGGEEFLVLLPETPIEGAKRVADSLRDELSALPIEWQGERVRITASFGIAAAIPSEVDRDAFIARADAALYRAKAEGRNCVRVAA